MVHCIYHSLKISLDTKLKRNPTKQTKPQKNELKTKIEGKEKGRYLEARSSEDANGGTGPGDVFVQIIKIIPRFLVGNEAAHVKHLASVP